MCIKTRFQCMNPDCLHRDTRYNECMTSTTCTTSIEIVERADGCCKCIYKDEQGPCVHRARQLHSGEVSRLQTTSHLAQSAGGDVDVFYSSGEESGCEGGEDAVRSIEQDHREEEEEAPAKEVVAEEADGHKDDQNSRGPGSYEPEPMLFEMEEV